MTSEPLNNSSKIILDLCGGTGAWSKPYKDNGYDVKLITLPDNDVLNYKPPNNVYGILSAPPCTMFSLARTNAKSPRDLREGMKTVIACLKIIWECQYNYNQKMTGYKTSLKFWALENPNGFLKYFLGKPAFQFQPYFWGDNYSKLTNLWGYFNPPDYLPLFANRGAMKDIKSISTIINNPKTRQELRSITPAGFANAFYKENK